MNEAARILTAIENGDRQAAGQLLPLVYDELRRLAARKLTRESPGQTLQATALVHEAYLRLRRPLDGLDAPGEPRRGTRGPDEGIGALQFERAAGYRARSRSVLGRPVDL